MCIARFALVGGATADIVLVFAAVHSLVDHATLNAIARLADWTPNLQVIHKLY